MPAATSKARGLDELRAAGLTPRLLSRIQAAAYVGLCPNAFDAAVGEGALPAPVALGASRRIMWDRAALDEAIDALGKRRDERPEPWTEVQAATGRIELRDPFAVEV